MNRSITEARRVLLASLLSLALVVINVASVSAQQVAPARTNSTPDVARLRAHIALLASDKLEGRRTGTKGAEAAARYIGEEFARLGLSTDYKNDGQYYRTYGTQAARHIQPFPYVAGVELGKLNAMRFIVENTSANTATGAPASLDLRVGEDFLPLGMTTNAQVAQSPVAFVGYGISAPANNHDDYAGVDVRDSLVVALSGAPDENDPHNALLRYADAYAKASAARTHGARALVLIAREAEFKNDRLARLRYEHGAGDAGLPVVVISRQVADRVLRASGSTLDAATQEPDKAKPIEAMTNAPVAASNNTRTPDSTRNAQDARDANAQRANAAPNTNGAQMMNDMRNANDMPRAPISRSRRLEGVRFAMQTDVTKRTVQAANVVGILEGSDAKLKGEAIILGAHYDHLGFGGAGSLAAREGEIHHGADDNASGVAGLLELARLLSMKENRPRRTVVFIAFGGEEEGLLGSSYYVNNPVVPLASTVMMLNMDMIGRLKDDKLIIGGVGTAKEFRDALGQLNVNRISTMVSSSQLSERDYVRFSLTLNEDGFGPSDHSSFYAKKIPVLFFFTGTHLDYHKPSDTADKINYEGEARIIQFVYHSILYIDNQDARPTYVQTSQPTDPSQMRTGFRVSLGTIPSYAESTDGMTLDGVRANSPAERAGLRAGDKVVRMAGREVRNVQDYTLALSEMKAGEEYEVEIVRGNEKLKLKIVPEARGR